MISSDDLEVIFERIVNHQETESDRQTLKSLLRGSNGDGKFQIGKHIVNISEGRDIHIGDKIYKGIDAKAIESVLRELIVKPEVKQEILTSNTVGRDLNIRDIQQNNIFIEKLYITAQYNKGKTEEKEEKTQETNTDLEENQWGRCKSFILSQRENSSFIKITQRAYLNIAPIGWFDWRPNANDVDEMFRQIEEMSHEKTNQSPRYNFINSVLRYLKDNPDFISIYEQFSITVDRQENDFEPKNDYEELYPELIQCYLIIRIRPLGSGKYMLKAIFIPDDLVEEDYGRFMELEVHTSETEISFTLEEMKIREILTNLIKQCHYKYIKGRDYELTIEVFLPQDLLCHPVEIWDYKDSQNCLISIGIEHNVVVRSLERLKNSDCISNWRKKWIKLNKLWESSIFENTFTTWIDSDFDRNILRKNFKHKIGVKVACNPFSYKMEELYCAIHSAGIPIMILSRCELININNSIEFKQVLENVKIRELPNQIKTLRENYSNLGNHLVLLWDDPNRVPPNYLLESPGL